LLGRFVFGIFREFECRLLGPLLVHSMLLLRDSQLLVNAQLFILRLILCRLLCLQGGQRLLLNSCLCAIELLEGFVLGLGSDPHLGLQPCQCFRVSSALHLRLEARQCGDGPLCDLHGIFHGLCSGLFGISHRLLFPLVVGDYPASLCLKSHKLFSEISRSLGHGIELLGGRSLRRCGLERINLLLHGCGRLS